MFFTENIVSKTTLPGLPWDFKVTETITEEVRHSYTARQDWYRNKTTKHCFYTFFEGCNPAQRVTKDRGENPPRLLHGVTADYDIALTETEILAGIAKMGDRKPAWREVSVGRKFRLVWLFESPMRMLNAAFAVGALKKLREWLPLDRLPGLDEPAFLDPSRLYCNGGEWHNLSNSAVSSETVNGLFVQIAQEFAYRGAEAGPEIPLSEVEKALTEKFPETFRWPTEFVLNSQGPSFWVPGSRSPMSALVKETGLFSFAAHADKAFYSWRDLLGREFVEKYEFQTIGEATKDSYFDGKHYFRKGPTGFYRSESPDDFRQYLKINCGASPKPGEDGVSKLDRCLQHVRDFGHVDGAASYVFRPSGILEISGKRFLNTWKPTILQPAASKTAWENMPFLSALLPRLLVTPEQLTWFLSWLSYGYKNALDKTPQPGHALFLSGGVNTGKTLLNRYIVGGVFGGFADATAFLLGDDAFNSELFECGVWCIDDETMSGDDRIRRRFASMVKKITANQEFRHNQKFQVACRVEWIGRLIVTLNFDQTSNRTLVDTEASMMDKVALLRTADKYEDYQFPSRPEIVSALQTELPLFARFLVDYEIPAGVCGDARYGIKPFHAGTMVEQASQSAPSAAFFELLSDWRTQYFQAEYSKAIWEGTTTQLLKSMLCDPAGAELLKKYTPEAAGRLLASIKAMGLMKIESFTGHGHIRHWQIFKENETAPTPETPAPISKPLTPNTKNPYNI